MEAIDGLSLRRRRILAYIHLNAAASYEDVAKACGTKSHVVRAEVQNLIHQKAIVPTVVVDQCLLGFLRTNIYFSILPLSVAERKKFITFLKGHPRIYWLCELVGEFDFGISIMYADVADLDLTMRQIMTVFPGVFRERQVATIASWTYFGKKYLVPSGRVAKPIHMSSFPRQVELSELDRAILKILSTNCFESQKTIAQKTKAPLSTVNHRLALLHERKVILGYVYWINYSRVKIYAYRMLISFGGITDELKKKIARFAEEHPHIVSLIFSLGSWDVEFGIDLEDANMIHSIISDLRELSRSEVFDVTSLLRFDDLKWDTVPPGMFDVR